MGGREPARVEVGLVELEQTQDQSSIILQEDFRAGLPLPPRASQATLHQHLTQDEVGVALGDLQKGVVLQGTRSFGKGSQHQSVPGSQHLIVGSGPHTLLTGCQQFSEAQRQLLRDLVHRHIKAFCQGGIRYHFAQHDLAFPSRMGALWCQSISILEELVTSTQR